MVIFLNFLKIKIMEFYKTYTSVVYKYKNVQNFVPFQLLQHDNVNWRGTLYLTSINQLNWNGQPFKLFLGLKIMSIQQPALGAIKSYCRQILTQLDAICEWVYNESGLPINTLMNSGKRLRDQSFLFIQKLGVLLASLSKPILMLKSFLLNLQSSSSPQLLSYICHWT